MEIEALVFYTAEKTILVPADEWDGSEEPIRHVLESETDSDIGEIVVIQSRPIEP